MDKLKIDIDSRAKWYPPFTVLAIVLIFGIGIFFYAISGRHVSEHLVKNYFYVLIGVLLLEIIAIQFVFPYEIIEFTVIENNELNFSYSYEGRVKEERIIKEIQYWWNHEFYSSRSYDDFYSSGNDGLGGASVASGVRLFLELKDQNGDQILLYETEGNWASTPHWKYSLRTYTEFEHKYQCLNLKKLIKELESKGLKSK